MSKDKDKKSFLGNLFGAIGLGLSLYGLKKVIDLYVEKDKENLINKDEYLQLLELEELKNKDEDGNLFRFDILASDVELDIFFKKFLEKVNEINEIPDKTFKLSDIEKLLPFEKLSMIDKYQYDKNIFQLITENTDKKYLEFDETLNIREELLSRLDKDYSIWRDYGDKEFIINERFYSTKRC